MKNTLNTVKGMAVSIGMMLLLMQPTQAQNDQAYIYGQVTMIDNKKFIGEIRWGDEEAFWDDMFNSSKQRNPFIKYLDREELKARENEDDDNNWRFSIDFSNIWEDGNRYGVATNHTFACRFGDMRRMAVTGRDDVKIEFKDGTIMDLEGGSNDLGNGINIYDNEIGEIELRWDRIDEIKFMDTPKTLEYKFGEPLYGKAETSKGAFEGYIIWDNDECLSTDKLDGDSDNGDVSIEFDKIVAIEAERRGATITLKSGRKLYLTGSNDVNEGNRGIVVKDQNFGRVLINWREFDKLTFTEPKTVGPAYSDFKTASKLKGKVVTLDGEEFSGNIVYDLDEEWNWEMLDGEDDGFEYAIPFEKIKRIIPKNYNYSTVELRSGNKILVGETQDVTDRNDGILVFKDSNDDDPTYIRWKEVKEVIFD